MTVRLKPSGGDDVAADLRAAGVSEPVIERVLDRLRVTRACYTFGDALEAVAVAAGESAAALRQFGEAARTAKRGEDT
jgi:hypothetical protein